MANGSRHRTAIVSEGSSYGTTPATPGFSTIRTKGLSLSLGKDGYQSEELRSDRQITDFRHGAKKVEGALDFELSYSSFDTLLEACLCGTWATKATITGTTLSAAASDNSYNDSGNGFVTAGFAVGDKVVVSGFTGAGANNISSGVITSVTAGKMIIGGTDGDVIVDDAAGESVTIATRSQVLKAGTTRRSFTVERYYADVDSADKPFHRFTGVELTGLQLQINANAMVTGSFSMVGKDSVLDTAIISGATYSAATTTSPVDAFTGAITLDGAAIAVVTEIQLTLENGIEPRYVIGSDTTIRPSIGRSNLTGTMTVYFEDSDMVEKFLNEEEDALVVNLPDAAGNNIKLTLPRIKYTGAPLEVKDEGPITIALPFQALYDSTSATQVTVERAPV